MSFLAPLYLLTLGFAIPIVLLWFLKQRREPIEVPTTFLWRKSLEEERVSPLIRNLTTSLLLLLQLLALLLLAFAAAAAVLNLRLSGEVRNVVLLVDRSASMGATDADGGSRLDAAKERVRELLSTLRGGDRAMLVAFDREAKILSNFTDDADALTRLLDRIEPRDAETAPAEALRTAAGATAALALGAAEIFLFSDGAFPPVEELPPGLEGASLTYVAAGKTGANAGIVSLTLQSGLDTGARLFVGVANAGEEPATRTLALRREDRTLDAREATVPPRSRGGAAFDLSDWGPGAYEVVLEPTDVLAADDRACVVLGDDPMRRILLVTRGNPALLRLRDIHPRVEVYSVPPDEVTADVGADVGRFDLTVFDGVQPETVAPGAGNLGPSALWIDCVPRDGDVGLGVPVADPEVVDWNRGHPLNRNVDWSDVRIARASPVVAPEGAVPLLETTEGPLVAALPGAGERVVFGFRLEESNLPIRLAFPIFLANLLDRAFHPGGAEGEGYVSAGHPITRVLPPGLESATVRDPAGRAETLKALPDGSVSFPGTDRTGFYRIDLGSTSERVAVSFLSEAETDIGPRETVDVAGEPVTSDPEAVEANYPLRRPLLWAALAVLLLEWTLWLRGLGRRRRPAAAPAPASAPAAAE